MTTKAQLVELNQWTLTIFQDGAESTNGAVDDFDEVDAGTSFAVAGVVPQGPPLFVYVVQVGDKDDAVVLYGASSPVAPGAHVRIPTEGWLTTALSEPLAVVGCAHTVADNEWSTLLGGHDGDIGNGSTSTSRTSK